MTNSTVRKTASLGFMTAVGVVALASIAWACTTFVGQISVTSGTGTSTAIGQGEASVSHSYCVTNPVQPGAVGTDGSPVVVAVAPGPACGAGDNTLDAGTYDIAFHNGSSFGSVGNFPYRRLDHCGPLTYPGKAGANGTVIVGSITVNAQGIGVASVTLPSTTATNTLGDASAICVNEVGGDADGNQAPIVII